MTLPQICDDCGRRHHSCEPHYMTDRFRNTYRSKWGVYPRSADTFSHCTGAMYAVALAALQSPQVSR